MVFSSSIFLFIFLPVVLVAHTLIRNTSGRNALLIVASLIFYAYGEPVYVVLLLASVAVNFVFGRILSDNKNKIVLAVAVILNILLLAVFKYTAFLVETVNCIPGINIPVPEITMPIGISFFTFQAVSYVIDTYRREDNGKAGFFDVLLYISLFPQLIAGPIVKYNSIREQIKNRSVTVNGLAGGIRRFIIGLSKKMLISNVMGEAADRIFAMDTGGIDTPLSWIGAVCYTLQIYFDFSGFCDMANGISLMMNIELPINFNSPYRSLSIGEFWDRWHITLTRFFTKYIYIPLGGSRKGTIRTYINIMIVFLISGIWHGNTINFVIWGLIHGVLSSISRAIKPIEDKIPKFIRWTVTFICINIAWVYFRAPSLGAANLMIKELFSFKFIPIDANFATYAFPKELELVPWLVNKFTKIKSTYYFSAFVNVFVVAFSLFASVKMKNTKERIDEFNATKKTMIICVVLLVWSVLSLSEVSGFIYVNF